MRRCQGIGGGDVEVAGHNRASVNPDGVGEGEVQRRRAVGGNISRLVKEVDLRGQPARQSNPCADGLSLAVQGEREGGVVVELFDPQDGRDRTHGDAMEHHVRVPAIGGRPIERLAGNPLAASQHAVVRPPDVDAGEHGSPVREGRGLIGKRPDVADADDPRAVVALHANDGVEAGPSLRVADIAGRTEARLHVQLRNARDDVGAVLEKVVGQREVAVVANQRRPEESGIRVVAAARDAERRAVPARANADQARAGPEQPLAVGLDHLHAIAVRVGGAERVGLASFHFRSAWPRRPSR